MPIDLRQCRHAIALAQHRNFDRAARALGLSQPALSRSIQMLEREVGVKLFNRRPQGVEPSDLGRIFLVKAQAVVLQSVDLEREMELLRGLDVGELRIGAGVFPSEMFVANALARMAVAHPAVRLTVCTNVAETLVGMLLRREVDLVIADGAAAAGQREIESIALTWHRAFIAVRSGHPLTRLKSPTLREILQYPMVMTTRLSPDLLAQLHRGRGGKPANERPNPTLPAMTCDSPTMMQIIVSMTDFITLTPRVLVSGNVAAGRLKLLRFEAPWLGRSFSILRIADRSLTPAAEAFIRLLKEADAEVNQASPERVERDRVGRRRLAM
jgi:DNA-binding transcriptional LysR family regulator